MIEYEAQLDNIPNTTDFSQDITANTTTLTFHFHWAADVQEITDVYDAALEARAKADPLLRGMDIQRDYEWLELYCDTIPHLDTEQIQEWLGSTGLVPSTLKDLPVDLQAAEIYSRCWEAEAIRDYLQPLYDRLVWTVEITDASNNSVSGVVRAGGWLNSQDTLWQVQFEADRDIGRDDLLLVTINIEVAEDE